MKKTLSILSALAIAAVLLASLAGCGQVPTLTLSDTEITITEKEGAYLAVSATAATGRDDTVTVASSDETVATATVNTSGTQVNITAVEVGTATITVTSASGETSSCAVTVEEGIEVYGTWIDSYDGKRVITNKYLISYNTSADTEFAYVFSIEEFNNSAWNGGETGANDCGYAVCLCINPPSWNTDQKGTYTVFRWQNLDTSGSATVYEFSEGSPPAWPNGYEDSADDAKANATDANGWFGFGYSAGTLQ